MRWEDERYVRVYTRDTPDWVSLGWEAQALFVLLLRKCDRAGTLDLGRSGKRGLAALLAMPLEVVERALDVLLEDGCVERHETQLVVRNFVSAQEAVASAARRAREYRERGRACAYAHDVEDDREPASFDDSSSGPKDAAPLAAPSQVRVTDRHEPSRAVTLCCAVPSRAEPNQDPPEVPPEGARRAARGARLREDWTPSEATIVRFREREGVDALGSLERFRNYWLGKTGRGAAKLDWERTFVNWVLEDIARDRAVACVNVREARPPEPDPDALAPRDARAHIEQLQCQLLGAGGVPWEQAG